MVLPSKVWYLVSLLKVRNFPTFATRTCRCVLSPLWLLKLLLSFPEYLLTHGLLRNQPNTLKLVYVQSTASFPCTQISCLYSPKLWVLDSFIQQEWNCLGLDLISLNWTFKNTLRKSLAKCRAHRGIWALGWLLSKANKEKKYVYQRIVFYVFCSFNSCL